MVKVRDGRGHPTTYGYTTRGERASRTDALDVGEAWRYDTSGRLTSHIDALTRTSTVSYDEHGRVDVEAGADGRVINRDWSSQGQPSLVVATNGADQQTMAYGYDDFGRRSSMTDPTGSSSYFYDPAGKPIWSIAPGGRNTVFGYDTAGRRSLAGLPDGSALNYSYDPGSGRLSSIKPGYRVADTFTAPDGSAMDGQKWSTSGSSSGATVLTAAGAARLQFPAAGGSAQLQYKATNKLADSNVAVRYRFEDNAPDAQFGLFARSSSAKNYRVTINANASLGELWKLSGGASTKLGEFAVAADTNWHFLRMEVSGNQLRVRAWDNPWFEPTTWNLQVTDSSVTGTGNNYAGYTKLGAGAQPARAMQLDQVFISNPAAPEPAVASYGWDKQGRLTSETTPDGSRTWGFDDGRLSQLAQNVPGAVFTTAVGYDDAGRIDSEVTGSASTSYDYDGAGQLTTVNRPGGTDTYGYDEVGRRITKNIAGAVTNYNYDDADQLSSTTGSGATTYTWDGSGRMLTSRTGATTTTYTYDPAGRLATARRGSATLTRSVNGDGQLRAVTTQSGTTTRFDWDPAGSIAEPTMITSANNATVLATVGGQSSAFRGGDTSKAMPVDVYGSALKTTATNGLAAASGYDAFGNPTTTVGFADVRLGYRGEITEHSLVHLRARQYNPATGAFTTRDPLDGVDGTPTVANPYHHTDNNPLNKIDPTGLRPDDCGFAEIMGSTPGTPSLGRSTSMPQCVPGSAGVLDCSKYDNVPLVASATADAGDSAARRYARLKEWARYEASADRAIFGVFDESRISPENPLVEERLLRATQIDSSANQTASGAARAGGLAKFGSRASATVNAISVVAVTEEAVEFYDCTGDALGAIDRGARGVGAVASAVAGAEAGAMAAGAACTAVAPGIGTVVCAAIGAAVGGIAGALGFEWFVAGLDRRRDAPSCYPMVIAHFC